MQLPFLLARLQPNQPRCTWNGPTHSAGSSSFNTAAVVCCRSLPPSERLGSIRPRLGSTGPVFAIASALHAHPLPRLLATTPWKNVDSSSKSTGLDGWPLERRLLDSEAPIAGFGWGVRALDGSFDAFGVKTPNLDCHVLRPTASHGDHPFVPSKAATYQLGSPTLRLLASSILTFLVLPGPHVQYRLLGQTSTLDRDDGSFCADHATRNAI